jgi:hypothetical protein
VAGGCGERVQVHDGGRQDLHPKTFCCSVQAASLRKPVFGCKSLGYWGCDKAQKSIEKSKEITPAGILPSSTKEI